MKNRCRICTRKDTPRIRVEQLTESVRVQDYPKRGLWFVVEKGEGLCPLHPRLDARFKPTEAMTPSNPRWQEFYTRLLGPEGCEFKGHGEDLTFKCSAGPDHAHSRKILSAMGLRQELIDASCRYFASAGGFCDCEVLFNVNPRPVRSRSGKNPARKKR